MKTTIRQEREMDYRAVEEITRRAFWNLHAPGCDEHYLAHLLRDHGDFVGELDLVIEVDGRVVGNIMYTKSSLLSETGERLETLTFGPVSIDPPYQGKGYGRELIARSMDMARDRGCPAVIIYGNPHNYCKHGFVSCRKKSVSHRGGLYPAGLLVRELQPGVLDGRSWAYEESEAYQFSHEGFEEFESGFPPLKKEFRWTQEEFDILCRAFQT